MGTEFEGIAYLMSLAHAEGGKDFGLDTPRRLMRALGDPQDALNTVHVGGTNGKGSVCSTSAAMLFAQSGSVGQFTSPHLSNVRERFVINGVPIENAELDHLLLEIREVAEQAGLRPSFFELTTATAFLLFARREVRWAVMEVGLGGRLDATNVIRRPALTAITGIALDHMQFLGNTTEAIAREKAGIVKAGSPLFVGRVERSEKKVIAECAQAFGVVPFFQDEDFGSQEGGVFVQNQQIPLDLSRRALIGRHQIDNAVLAAAICCELGVSPENLQQGLEIVRWPARLELISKKQHSFLLDAAHNPQGMEALCEFLANEWDARFSKIRSIQVLFGVLARKEWQSMLRILHETLNQIARSRGLSLEFLFSQSDHPASVPPEEPQRFLGEGQLVSNPIAWIEECAGDPSPDRLTILTGSIYLLGMLRPILSREFRTLKSLQSPRSST